MAAPIAEGRNHPLEVNGLRLDAAWWGPPPEAAPTLVLLHEGLGSVGLWRGFPAALARETGCGVVAYSRAGYGRSDPVPLPRSLAYMREEATLTLPNVLDTLRVRRAILVGHSDGASIAAIYAGSHQDFRIHGIVLIAPHFFVEDISVAAISEAERAYETGDLRTRLARHHDHVDIAFRGWNDSWLHPDFAKAFDLTPDIAHIRVPVLIVQGDADPYGTLAHAETAVREAYCPVEVAVLAGVGHSPHLEAPDPALPPMTAFIRHIVDTP